MIAVTPVVIINGGWSSWTSWNTCSKSCGSGKQHRVRQCDNPKPSRNGRTCQGKALDERLCNEQKCPSGMYLRSRYDLESLNTNTPDRHCHIALNPPHRWFQNKATPKLSRLVLSFVESECVSCKATRRIGLQRTLRPWMRLKKIDPFKCCINHISLLYLCFFLTYDMFKVRTVVFTYSLWSRIPSGQRKI